MDSNDKPDPTAKPNEEELDNVVSKLINKWKNMSLDEDSDDDFHPDRDDDSPEYANDELWSVRYYRWRCKKTIKHEHFDPLIHGKPISFEESTRLVAPEFKYSVLLTSPDHWDIGSLMTCEKIEPDSDVPLDIVCKWIDDGSTYCLRKRSVPISKPSNSNWKVGEIVVSPFRGVWTLSPNVFCKTQRWVEGVTPDSESIRFVNEKIPSIPTEDIIYDWIDHDWYRWFMISRRTSGTLFSEAWPQLSSYQKYGLAEKIAKHAKSLADFTSEYIETITGQGVEGKCRLGEREDLPNWKPLIEPRASREEYKKFVEAKWGKKNVVPPDPGVPFVLQHRDLTPTNMFVTVPEDPEEKAEVTAIIDWQSLAYHEKWQVATAPRGLWSYAVANQEDGGMWPWMLSNALYDQGFPLELEFMGHLVPKEHLCTYGLPWERERCDGQQEGIQADTKDNDDSESFEKNIREERENGRG